MFDWIGNKGIEQTLEYFRANMTVIDWTIIGLGLFIIFYQLMTRLFTPTGRRLFDRADKDPRTIHKIEIRLQMTSTLIEILPYLGIMGTVWGLMRGLVVIKDASDPTVAVIAQQIAPAMSTTFLGLVFAVVNLFAFNFMSGVIRESIEGYRAYQADRAARELLKLEAEEMLKARKFLEHKERLEAKDPRGSKRRLEAEAERHARDALGGYADEDGDSTRTIQGGTPPWESGR